MFFLSPTCASLLGASHLSMAPSTEPQEAPRTERGSSEAGHLGATWKPLRAGVKGPAEGKTSKKLTKKRIFLLERWEEISTTCKWLLIYYMSPKENIESYQTQPVLRCHILATKNAIQNPLMYVSLLHILAQDPAAKSKTLEGISSASGCFAQWTSVPITGGCYYMGVG